jgi:hypothetical protein
MVVMEIARTMKWRGWRQRLGGDGDSKGQPDNKEGMMVMVVSWLEKKIRWWWWCDRRRTWDIVAGEDEVRVVGRTAMVRRMIGDGGVRSEGDIGSGEGNISDDFKHC